MEAQRSSWTISSKMDRDEKEPKECSKRLWWGSPEKLTEFPSKTTFNTGNSSSRRESEISYETLSLHSISLVLKL